MREVHKFALGTPRLINALCDRALLIGYTQEVRDVTARIIKRASSEIRGQKAVRRGFSEQMRRYIPSPTFIALVILVVLAGAYIVEPLARGFPSERSGDSSVAAPTDSVPSTPNHSGKAMASAKDPAAPAKPDLEPAGDRDRSLIELLDGIDATVLADFRLFVI